MCNSYHQILLDNSEYIKSDFENKQKRTASQLKATVTIILGRMQCDVTEQLLADCLFIVYRHCQENLDSLMTKQILDKIYRYYTHDHQVNRRPREVELIMIFYMGYMTERDRRVELSDRDIDQLNSIVTAN
jgi:hypothetical protein